MEDQARPHQPARRRHREQLPEGAIADDIPDMPGLGFYLVLVRGVRAEFDPVGLKPQVFRTIPDEKDRRQHQNPPDKKRQHDPGAFPAQGLDQEGVQKGKGHHREAPAQAGNGRCKTAAKRKPFTDQPGRDQRKGSLSERPHATETGVKSQETAHLRHRKARNSQQKGDHRQHPPGSQAVNQPAHPGKQHAAHDGGESVGQRVIRFRHLKRGPHGIFECRYRIRLAGSRHKLRSRRNAQHRPAREIPISPARRIRGLGSCHVGL